MDLTQVKLSKTEWNSIEIPVQEDEQTTLKMIEDGYSNINIRVNKNQSLMSIVKIDDTAENHAYIYKTYFDAEIKEYMSKYNSDNGWKDIQTKWLKSVQSAITKPPKKIDIMRLTNINSQIETQRPNIFEYVLVDLIRIVLYIAPTDGGKKKSKSAANLQWTPPYSPTVALYTLIQLQKSTIAKLNTFMAKIVDIVIQFHLSLDNNSKPEGEKESTVESLSVITKMFYESKEIIEKNPFLLKYADRTLYDHQKRLFQLFRQPSNTSMEAVPTSKLVLYIAPTGTGKTLSPLGLLCQYRIIFVCVARHVGLALAKSAISMEKKVAFAFGCETAADIRLHYFAAKDYSKNVRTGGIGKVDNSVGDRVEIMICDVKSYITAMLYMLAFNDESRIITYWDEPTMTMDYEEHDLHTTIARNWCENRISKMVLSCATLPKEAEIADTIMSFRDKFYNMETGAIPEIHSIISYDCKKSISILDKSMKCVLPHLLFSDFAELRQSVAHCMDNKSLLRYFDLSEIVRFIRYLNYKGWLPERYRIDAYFHSVADITMDNIKLYYLDTLRNIDGENWTTIFEDMINQQSPKYSETKKPAPIKKSQSVDSSNIRNSVLEIGKPLQRTSSVNSVNSLNPIQKSSLDLLQKNSLNSDQKNPISTAGTLITTTDAYTITDGPVIFLTEDPTKTSKFFVQQTNIPTKVLDKLLERIETNNTIQQKLSALEKALEDKTGEKDTPSGGKSAGNPGGAARDKKAERDAANDNYSPEVKRLKNEIERLRLEIKIANMDACYIPNTVQHQYMWLPDEWRERNADKLKHGFVPRIDSQSVRDIMELAVDTNLKLLLMIGIGVFIMDIDTRYLEIMKRLAYEQKLFLIIAGSDYLYGTNYQFAHGFLGKDLMTMTQQKTIQAMGRIGRGNIQQEYTIRFRDDSILRGLFLPQVRNLEAEIMSRLFST